MEYIDYEDPVKLTVLRGQQLIEFTLQSAGPPPAARRDSHDGMLIRNATWQIAGLKVPAENRNFTLDLFRGL